MSPFTLSSLLRSGLLLLSMFLLLRPVLAADWALSFGKPVQWARINAKAVDDARRHKRGMAINDIAARHPCPSPA